MKGRKFTNLCPTVKMQQVSTVLANDCRTGSYFSAWSCAYLRKNNSKAEWRRRTNWIHLTTMSLHGQLWKKLSQICFVEFFKLVFLIWWLRLVHNNRKIRSKISFTFGAIFCVTSNPTVQPINWKLIFKFGERIARNKHSSVRFYKSTNTTEAKDK